MTTFPYSICAVLCLVVLSACNEPVNDGNNESSWLFTQSAMVGELYFFEDEQDDFIGYLTVHAAKPVLAFTDRPDRETKFISNEEFASFWQLDSPQSFGTVPPNAILHFRLDQEHVFFDVPIVMSNGVYLESQNLNTMMYDIQHDGTASLRLLWDELKDSPLCAEASHEWGTSRRCIIQSPVLFIDNFFSDIGNWVSGAASTVSEAVVSTATSLADPTNVCVIGLTSTIMAGLAADGEEETFDIAFAIAEKAGDAAAEHAACEVISASIHSIDSRLDEASFASTCGTVARSAISPTGAVVHAASCLICGAPVD